MRLNSGNTKSGLAGGISQGEYDRLSYELEETKRRLMQIQRERSASNLLGNGASSVDQDRMNEIVRDYLEEIEKLKAENEDLRLMGTMSPSGKNDQLQMQLSSLQRERDLLKEKVRELKSTLEMKNRELSNLRSSGGGFGGGGDTEAVRTLQETNERLMQEVLRLQDQLKNPDSFNSLSMASNSLIGK